MKTLLASVAFALLAAASSAQTPRKIVTEHFSVVLPSGEPKTRRRHKTGSYSQAPKKKSKYGLKTGARRARKRSNPFTVSQVFNTTKYFSLDMGIIQLFAPIVNFSTYRNMSLV